jgi:hypothetical protein
MLKRKEEEGKWIVQKTCKKNQLTTGKKRGGERKVRTRRRERSVVHDIS